MKISSPMPTGSGAIVVHSHLEKHLSGYRINPYSPKYEYLPFLIRKFSDKNADVIHTTPDYGIFHARKQQKLVLTIHGYFFDDEIQSSCTSIQRIHYKTDLRLFTKLSLQRADVVTAVSQFVADKTKEDLAYKGEIIVIPNGVDEQLFKPDNTKKKSVRIKVLFSGNLTKRKGAQWILPILEQLDSHIDIIYTSGLRGKSKLPSHPRLLNAGSIPYNEMPDFYNQMDILLMPTVREGLSLAVLEAMACGLPIVASDCSSLPEQVHHKQGGYLCAIGDVDDFAKKINLLASDNILRKEMGGYNRKRIEDNYTLSRMIREYKIILNI